MTELLIGCGAITIIMATVSSIAWCWYWKRERNYHLSKNVSSLGNKWGDT
jgi:hypothetical protein